MKQGLRTLMHACILIGSVLLIVLTWSFHKPYYRTMYQQERVADTLMISEDTLWEATEVLFDYLHGNKATLDMPIEVNGVQTEMFSIREKDHMVDVLQLMHVATQVMLGSLLVGFGVAFVLLATQSFGTKQDHIRAMRWVFGCFGMIGLGIGLFALVDFDAFWIQFHELLFSNDLWLLDPSVDRLVVMVNQNFFMGLVYRIIGSLGLLFAAYGGIYGWCHYRKKERI